MKNEQPFETTGHDLTGHASLDLHRKEDFALLSAKLTDYNPDRFEPVALKVFIENNDPIITLYALDKSKQEQSDYPPEKIPVKKFKLHMSLHEFLSYIKSFDIVVSNGNFDMKDILVINK